MMLETIRNVVGSLNTGRLGTTSRIAFAMAMWTAMVLLCIRLSGLWDDGYQAELRQRTRLAETAAIGCSQLASNDLETSIPAYLDTLRHRNPELLSVGYRLTEGELLADFGDHVAHWTGARSNGLNRIEVPVIRGDQQHATVQLAFEAPVGNGLRGFLQLPSVRIILLATLVNLIGFSFLLRRCFRQMNPAQVVPERVRSALDTMAELILILDDQNRIMFANCHLTEILGGSWEDFQGRNLLDLPWLEDCRGAFQWENETHADENVALRVDPDQVRLYRLNSSLIYDDAGIRRGRLLSLNDMTDVEAKSAELRATLKDLENTQQELAEHNNKLQYLATRDPMTGCLNRRSFFESFESLWNSAVRYGHALSCVMVDVDHFKSINDNYGHAMGDTVLKDVAAALLETARDSDLVCRYGGEEFCVLLPHVGVDGATQAAERFRNAIGALEFPQLSVTASLGCSDLSAQAESHELLLEQADQALYFAKRNGRNQVCAFTEELQREAVEQP